MARARRAHAGRARSRPAPARRRLRHRPVRGARRRAARRAGVGRRPLGRDAATGASPAGRARRRLAQAPSRASCRSGTGGSTPRTRTWCCTCVDDRPAAIAELAAGARARRRGSRSARSRRSTSSEFFLNPYFPSIPAIDLRPLPRPRRPVPASSSGRLRRRGGRIASTRPVQADADRRPRARPRPLHLDATPARRREYDAGLARLERDVAAGTERVRLHARVGAGHRDAARIDLHPAVSRIPRRTPGRRRSPGGARRWRPARRIDSATRPTATTVRGRTSSISRMANAAPASISAVGRPAVRERLAGRGGDGSAPCSTGSRAARPRARPSTRCTIVPDGSLQPARRRSVGRYGVAPAGQVALRRERDPRPAHALVSGRLTQRDDVGPGPLGQVGAQVREPDRGGVRRRRPARPRRTG